MRQFVRRLRCAVGWHRFEDLGFHMTLTATGYRLKACLWCKTSFADFGYYTMRIRP